jgi:hypothetical protein
MNRLGPAILLLGTQAPWKAAADTLGAVRPAGGAGERAVAFTFDDLPATRHGSLADVRTVTRRLLGHLERCGIGPPGS